MPLETVVEMVNSASWYHAFELLPGVVTPGRSPFDARGFLDSLELPRDLRGKRALDIGTWDGPAAFELEARGATVVGLDIQDPDQTGFNTAKAILRSKVAYVRGSVYDLSRLVQGKFDIICYFGVFYHLKHPILGFEEIAKALDPNGQLLFEGECLRNYAEALDGPVGHGRKLDLRALAHSNVPLALCYPGRFKNSSNWFVPNYACLQSWMAAAGLDILHHYFTEDAAATPYPRQRAGGVARLKQAASPVEEEQFVQQPPAERALGQRRAVDQDLQHVVAAAAVLGQGAD
jgi:tRNA (mo5U34)-methyltransferase